MLVRFKKWLESTFVLQAALCCFALSLFFQQASAQPEFVEEMEGVEAERLAQEFPTQESQAKEYNEEKVRLLKILKEEIEPNLIPKDKDRLKRNVMRLGSYRVGWAEEAMSFLVANSALSELYLYDYARIKNERLNERIVQSLTRFESFKYPLAALAFAEDLSLNSSGRAALLPLFEQVIERSSPDSRLQMKAYVDFVLSSWGTGLEPAARLRIALKACQAGVFFDLNERGRLESFFRSRPDVWSRVVFEELKVCFEGS